ncbi:MAG: PrsW family glutamic-type intramembrane protease [Saprospiraceae bacterium]
MLHIQCPHCGQSHQFPESTESRTVVCPDCQQSFVIPGLSNQRSNLGDEVLRRGRKMARDLHSISFRDEIMPLTQSNFVRFSRSFTFWGITLLGMIPLLIVTVDRTEAQLTLFALFFALVWGVIFKKFVLGDQGAWTWAIGSLFFTGIFGIWFLLFLYRYIVPDFYLQMADQSNPVVSLLGYVFQVGIWEEMCKALPVILVLKWIDPKLDRASILVIGLFSGLGFAAFENLNYGTNAVNSAYSLTRDYGVGGLVSGVQNAMVITLLRSVSLVFCHAVWTGIFTYFIGLSVINKDRRAAFFLTGLMVAALLHGMYDWLAGIQPTLAALLAGFSFVLFYAYVQKLTAERGPGGNQRGLMIYAKK